jgi:hypothetical protein
VDQDELGAGPATTEGAAGLAAVKGMSMPPVIPVPRGALFQPVDTDEVATELAG